MLTEQQRSVLSQVSIIDVIDFFGVERILSVIDPIHGVIIWGWERVFKALERYENHKS